MKSEALRIAQTISQIPFASLMDYPASGRFKLIAEKGIRTGKKKGSQKWGNVHYYSSYVKLVLDFPYGTLEEEQIRETLGLSVSPEGISSTGYYLKGELGDEIQTLNIKLYGADARDEHIFERVVRSAHLVFEVMSCK